MDLHIPDVVRCPAITIVQMGTKQALHSETGEWVNQQVVQHLKR